MCAVAQSDMASASACQPRPGAAWCRIAAAGAAQSCRPD
ncbi:UNVERIFIED_CONTAM: hypothetical protein GTU68_023299 [Idotea baltica]|nr:hypothetical protein [Idotea baltica]